MAIEHIWILPVFISFYSIFTLLVCYSTSAAYGHVPSRWPFLDEIARLAPESCIHCMMNNHMAILLAIWMYIKHSEIVSYLSMTSSISHRWNKLSTVSMFIGLFAALSLQISANFPSHKISSIEGWATLSTSISWSLYIILHSIVSLSVVDPTIPRKGIFLVRLCIAMAVFSFSASILRTLIVTGSLTTKKDNSMEALCEWGVYFLLSLFLLTDSYEFRCLSISALKLIIPGSPLFDHVEHESRNRSDTHASDFDPRHSYLSQPLIR